MHGIISANDQIALFLEQAKALIDHPDKWIQHKYESMDRRCAMQAIRDVTNESSHLYLAVGRALANCDGEPDSVVCNFNDSHSHSEVMDYFTGAIQRLRSLSVLRTSV